ncbi:MAG: TonB-dependent receptor [Asticcacaulis sp.]|nr:TonB-dependent receptor [Asticcacaulis sp.]
MKNSGSTAAGLQLLKGGVSLLALTALAVVSTPAMAQDAKKSDEVVVVGVRKALKSAQQIKKDADTVVDSITASDIGSFPDKSVAEALQRVAGITVSRFAATGDTAHFSAEPSGVLVRGLSQVRSEFNGRDTFSANSSRGLSWGDVSPELMAGVDTYKNQTADLIEGGIAGSIDLRTRKPFDSKGQVLAISADVSYHDLAKKTTPDISGIYSNRWDTELGEFGAMVNYAYSKVETDTQGDQLQRIKIFDKSVFNTPVTAQDPLGRAYIPSGVTYHDTLYTRTRKGIAASAQWQNHDHTMIATLQYNDSSYQNDWEEHYVGASAFGVWQLPASNVSSDKTVVQPLAGTSPFTFGTDGSFLTGVQSSNIFDGTQPVGGWGSSGAIPLGFGSNSSGQPFYTACYDYSWAGGTGSQATCPRQTSGITTGTRFATTVEKTQDTSFNFKWDPTSKLKLNFDVQYVHATVDNYDMTADTATFGVVAYDYAGKYPKITISTPTATNGDFAANTGGVANPSNYRYNDLMDHAETSGGHEFSTRLDAQYNFSEGWLSSLKVGVRYADREQKLRWSTYNWNDISSPWSNASPNNTTCYSVASSCYPKEYETLAFSPDLLGGGLINGANANVFSFTSMSAIKDRAGFAAAMNEAALGKAYNGDPTSFKGWTPLCNRNSGDPLWLSAPGNDANADGCYRNQELTSVSEKTTAGYLELKFGGNEHTLFGKPVSGNLGVRWVQTVDASKGYLSLPGTSWIGTCIAPGGTSPACLATGTTSPNLAKAIAFTSGSSQGLESDVTHINWLPSFNLKVNLTDQWILRFAASRAMSRPDMGYFKNYVSISAPSIDSSSSCGTTGGCVKNSAGVITDYNPIFTASAGNPGIKSTTADQFDLTAEDYFASVGSFTVDMFYKKFYDYIQYGSYNVAVTSNGATENVRVNGPVNGDGAQIKGFEIAYQRFFDFLPGIWSGLGIQANYTHLANKGISNTHVSNVSGSGKLNTGGSGIDQTVESIDPHALEGLSNDSYNVVGMYEKGAWAARLAYNWRSKYLVSASDCCVGLPVWQKQAGFLDGSVRYKLNDNIELNVSASNILGTQTVLLQQIEGDIPGKTPGADMKLFPNAWWKNDRNFQVGVRLKY